MKLSKNFKLKEFTRSAVAHRNGIDNTPNSEQLRNIKELVEDLLQPLRDRIGCVITINSGFRCKHLNSLVGGAYKSQHTFGKASDIDVSCMPLQEVFKIITNEFEFDKVILEFGEWIHVSYAKGKNRKIVLIAKKVNGVTVYKNFEGEF